MSENRLLDYLDHIQQAATDARSFVEGMTKDDFLADKRTQQAIIPVSHRVCGVGGYRRCHRPDAGKRALQSAPGEATVVPGTPATGTPARIRAKDHGFMSQRGGYGCIRPSCALGYCQ